MFISAAVVRTRTVIKYSDRANPFFPIPRKYYKYAVYYSHDIIIHCFPGDCLKRNDLFSFDTLCEALSLSCFPSSRGPAVAFLSAAFVLRPPYFRAPLESSRRCCRRRGDKSSLSLPGPLSQAGTRELTDRTVAIKPPRKGFEEHSAPRTVPMVALWVSVRGKRTGGRVIKERDAREGDEAQISSTTPARCTRRRMIPCVAAGS